MRRNDGEDSDQIEKSIRKINPFGEYYIHCASSPIAVSYKKYKLEKRSSGIGMIIVSRGPNSNSRMLDSFVKDDA